MQAVVLVGGQGLRLRPLTSTTPKPLIPVANRPLLAHILTWLAESGVEEVILATQYAAQAFKPFLEQWDGIPVRAVEEPVPLGTAGAVRNLRQWLHGTTVVVNGDNLCNLDLRAMADYHTQHRSMATIAVAQIADVSGKGVVVSDAQGRVTMFQEKPAPGTARASTVNAGTYIIDPTVVDLLVQGQPAMWETDLFPRLIAAGTPIYAAALPHVWLDVGTPEGYLRAQALVLQGSVGHPAGNELRPRLWAEPNVSLAPDFAAGHGVSCGFGATIATDVTITGTAMIGRETHILAGTAITNSAIWDSTLVEAGARIIDTIVGYNCYIGAGVQITGALLGDGCIVRAGTVLEAGARLTPGTTR
ncbi:MAG: NDP-sugar synthase [Herpetosiphon sp.]